MLVSAVLIVALNNNSGIAIDKSKRSFCALIEVNSSTYCLIVLKPLKRQRWKNCFCLHLCGKLWKMLKICELLLLLTTYPVAHWRDLQTKNPVVDLQLVFLNENYLQSSQIKKLL